MLSQSGNGDSFPKGTILPYTGLLSEIPSGWQLCDGTNGTPNLQGMFLRGAGAQNIGGTVYSSSFGLFQTDAIRDTFGKGSFNTQSCNLSISGLPPQANGVFKYSSRIGARIGGDIKNDSNALWIDFDLTNGQNTANEFRPVNYSVYYIIKVK